MNNSLRDYYQDELREKFHDLGLPETSLEESVEEKLNDSYYLFPDCTQPEISTGRRLWKYGLHVLGSFLVILNFWIFKSYFNLIFSNVKLNPVRKYNTKRVEIMKRDKRFKTGYRDESYTKTKIKIEPNPDLPYWTLSPAEKKRNVLYFILITIGYCIGLYALISTGEDNAFVQGYFLCMIIGAIWSYLSVNKLSGKTVEDTNDFI